MVFSSKVKMMYKYSTYLMAVLPLLVLLAKSVSDKMASKQVLMVADTDADTDTDTKSGFVKRELGHDRLLSNFFPK